MKCESASHAADTPYPRRSMSLQWLTSALCAICASAAWPSWVSFACCELSSLRLAASAAVALVALAAAALASYNVWEKTTTYRHEEAYDCIKELLNESDRITPTSE